MFECVLPDVQIPSNKNQIFVFYNFIYEDNFYHKMFTCMITSVQSMLHLGTVQTLHCHCTLYGRTFNNLASILKLKRK